MITDTRTGNGSNLSIRVDGTGMPAAQLTGEGLRRQMSGTSSFRWFSAARNRTRAPACILIPPMTTSLDHGFGIVFPFAAGTGFALRTLEQAFRSVGTTLAGTPDRVHVLFGEPTSLDTEVRADAVDTFAWDRQTPEQLERLRTWIERYRITTVFGLDLPVASPAFTVMRGAGVNSIVSYWGAPMSSIHRRAMLFVKRLQVATTFHGPDHYIFESEAMRATAVAGRGIAAANTSVVPTGIDPTRFRPTSESSSYAHDTFGIPVDRKIVIYSGHFEARKGVAVLIDCARYLVDQCHDRQLHFLLCGDRDTEAAAFRTRLQGSAAEQFVTFGGYRTDIVSLYQSAWAGCIASTGWDSFPMSALEMQSSGLPVFVSALQGIPETIDEGTTGISFPPGDHVALAQRLLALAADDQHRAAMSRRATEWVARRFTREHQHRSLTEVISQIMRRGEAKWRTVDSNGVVTR